MLSLDYETKNKTNNKHNYFKMANIQENQYDLFFGGTVSEYFNGHKNLYLGDKDFIWADQIINMTAEIKTISNNNTFEGKRLTFNQAREYSSTVNQKDNLGRIQTAYLFEYHKYVKEPYVIVVPFRPFLDNMVKAVDFLDIQKAKMLYISKDNQFSRWIVGDHTVGAPAKKELLCV